MPFIGLNSTFKTLPINSEQLKGSGFVTDRTSPGGLLLVHLQEEDGIETLQVRTGEHSARHPQAHLYQLQRQTSPVSHCGRQTLTTQHHHH